MTKLDTETRDRAERRSSDPLSGEEDEAARVSEYLSGFENHYHYDVTYIRELYGVSPASYRAFEGFLPMGQVREATPVDAWFTAKLAAMQAEDCGPCLQLTVNMAREAGMAPETICAVLYDKDGDAASTLSSKLRDVRQFTRNVVSNAPEDTALRGRLEEQYGAAAIAELSLTIAAARVYPTIKRGMGHAKSCSLVEIEV